MTLHTPLTQAPAPELQCVPSSTFPAFETKLPPTKQNNVQSPKQKIQLIQH
jgi:hypothetical protein